MAQINKPTEHFNTVIWTGNGSKITTGLTPDLIWYKARDVSSYGGVVNAISGNDYYVQTYSTDAETNSAGLLVSDSTGFTPGSVFSTNSYVAWNWLAGGTAPSQTYTVKVVSDSGNKYRFDDFGTSAVTLDLQEGGTYTFDQSDSSNSGHPLRFSTTSDGTHGGGSEYTTNVTTTGTPGSAGAKTVITVASSAPTLYYYCSVHSGMGGQANTNSTFGSSNFGGSIQANVSANTTSGFSIVSYTGNSTAGATVGHGLNAVPSMIIWKNLGTDSWGVYHKSIGNTNALFLDLTNGSTSFTTLVNSTTPSSSVITLGSSTNSNNSGGMIAYCFAEKKGYSKFGSYTGNGSSDGSFIYTGFKPAFVMIKRTSPTGEAWWMWDSKRDTYNLTTHGLFANASSAEVNYSASNQMNLDLLSNGFKFRATDGAINGSGQSYIYMAFAEQPLVGTNNIPATAR